MENDTYYLNTETAVNVAMKLICDRFNIMYLYTVMYLRQQK